MSIKKNELKVLRALCKDARRTLEDIGNETGLTGPGVGKIIDRLEKNDVITGYIAVPALEKVGFNIVHLLLFRMDHSKGKAKDLQKYLRSTNRIVFATTVEGSGFTHLMVSAHADFAQLEKFLTDFRSRWDEAISEDTSVLLSPRSTIKDLSFEVF
jgi:Lrp/AsnC family leucine-responsive transcriptional regulator